MNNDGVLDKVIKAIQESIDCGALTKAALKYILAHYQISFQMPIVVSLYALGEVAALEISKGIHDMIVCQSGSKLNDLLRELGVPCLFTEGPGRICITDYSKRDTSPAFIHLDPKDITEIMLAVPGRGYKYHAETKILSLEEWILLPSTLESCGEDFVITSMEKKIGNVFEVKIVYWKKMRY